MGLDAGLLVGPSLGPTLGPAVGDFEGDAPTDQGRIGYWFQGSVLLGSCSYSE